MNANSIFNLNVKTIIHMNAKSIMNRNVKKNHKYECTFNHKYKCKKDYKYECKMPNSYDLTLSIQESESDKEWNITAILPKLQCPEFKSDCTGLWIMNYFLPFSHRRNATSPSLLCLCFYGKCSGELHYFKQFRLSNLTPIIPNTRGQFTFIPLVNLR